MEWETKPAKIKKGKLDELPDPIAAAKCQASPHKMKSHGSCFEVFTRLIVNLFFHLSYHRTVADERI